MSRTRTLRRILAPSAVALSVLSVAACTEAGHTKANPSANAAANRALRGHFELASALVGVDSCDGLLDYLHTEATKRVTAYGLPGVGGGGMFAAEDRAASGSAASPTPMMTSTVPAAATPPASVPTALSGSQDAALTGVPAAEAAGPGFSSTNVVEAGVDEPDRVKTDGAHLYAWANGTLRVFRTGEDAPAAQIATLELSGYGGQLLLAGTKLLVLRTPAEAVADDQPPPPATASSRPRYQGQRTALALVDVSDPAKPKLERELIADGQVLSARMVDGVARVVVQSSPNNLGFVQPSVPGADDRALTLNRQIIAESTIDDWAPHYELLDGNGKEQERGQLVQCDGYNHPPTFAGFSTLSVLTVDIAAGLSPDNGTAIVADGQRVYASKDNLYVALSNIGQAFPVPMTTVAAAGAGAGQPLPAGVVRTEPAPDNAGTTSIHMFSIAGKAAANYVASGEVSGTLLNDFSMSEYGGVLRVAATNDLVFGRAGATSESHISVLRRDGTALRQVGDVGGLGKGERIYAVRFVGPVGYVVTFRQTDPLYTVDLSKPESPTLAGELELLGYSAYLHPLGNGRLLGIGQDANERGARQGAQISLFDVSDVAHPTRLAQTVLPNGWSGAESDYHAFLWWAADHLALVPLNGFDPATGVPFASMVGFDVADNTIAERGRVSHPAPTAGCEERGDGVAPGDASTRPAPPSMPCYWQPLSQVDRAVVVGNRLYTLSDSGLMVNMLSSFTQETWLPFG